MQKKNIKSTDFTLWEIEFEITISYDKYKFTLEEAKQDFVTKIGAEGEHDEILGKAFDEIILTTEIQYFACDSGHGGNIINDCLNALREDSPGFNEADYEYRWTKLDYMHYINEPYISWALEISSYGQITYDNEILSGKCLGLIWDGCECENCL